MKNVDNSKRIIANQLKLIDEFKKQKLPAILVFGKDRKKQNAVMIRLWGEEFKDNPSGKEVISELANKKYDKIVKKEEYDVFYKTDFEKYCKKNKIDKLYFTGIYSGCCVFFS